MPTPSFVPLLSYQRLPEPEMLAHATAFAERMATRRTVRDFSAEEVPEAVIEQALRAAITAPSGANQQPWRFVAIKDPAIKKQIREAAESEEREFYERRAPDEWLAALAPLGTDAEKPFLERAPWLIAIFYERFGLDDQGEKVKRYYPHESVGLASGILIAALHQAGLATLTHTPSPMGFLNDILGRGKNEMPYLLLVAGYPEPNCQVPNITRLPFETVVQFR